MDFIVKITEILSFSKQKKHLRCFDEQGLGEGKGLLELDTRSAEFMEHKSILQEAEEKGKGKKTPRYICVPARGKNRSYKD